MKHQCRSCYNCDMSLSAAQRASHHAMLSSRQAHKTGGPPEAKSPYPRLTDVRPLIGTTSVSAPEAIYAEAKLTYAVSSVPVTSPQSSAAAAFFARAAQKLNLTSIHRHRRHTTDEELTEGMSVGRDIGDYDVSGGRCSYSKALFRQPPPVPPALLRRIGVKEVSGVGKVKVMLKVCKGFESMEIDGKRIVNNAFKKDNAAKLAPSTGTQSGCVHATQATSNACITSTLPTSSSSVSFFNIDIRKKQVTLFDPLACGGSSAPEDRRVGVEAPKMFSFDAIFTQDDSMTEICASALTDLIHTVINGADGCLFCFGHSKLGKTCTMVGSAESANTLGIIPCAISWLFRSISEQKQKTGARFSVRVSAVEIVGPSQHLRDLLADHATDSELSPGVYLRDDPLFGTTLQNQSELRVPTPEKAAFYLDIAMHNRSAEEETRDSHMLYTLHVYQYSVAGKGGVAGGRSRLHLIDLGSCERGKTNGGISLSGLGNVLLAIFNGQKHLPYREHKITRLLKECLGSLTCHAAMIVHVSPYARDYNDTLSTIQLASRIHRMRRRKIKLWGGSAGSGGSSGDEASRLQTQEQGRSTGSSDMDPSSSEQSADTVIYIGPSDEATDGEHPPVYIPSLNSGDNRCAMNKALRGSWAERRTTLSSCRNHSGKSQYCSISAPQKLTNHNLDNRTSALLRCTSNKTNSQTLISKTLTEHLRSCKSSSGCVAIKISDKSVDNCKDSVLETVNKLPVCANNTYCTVTGSDEQWIDGPRISKIKVAEAWHLLKDNSKKNETWVDGPLQVAKGHSSMSYGFMDSHKKNMIRKWVENQTVQIQKQTGKSNVEHQQNVQSVVIQAVKDTGQVSSNSNYSDDYRTLKNIILSVENTNTKCRHKVNNSLNVCSLQHDLLLGSRGVFMLAGGAVGKNVSTHSSRSDILLKRNEAGSECDQLNTSNSETPNVSMELSLPYKEVSSDMEKKNPSRKIQFAENQHGKLEAYHQDEEIFEVVESCEPVSMQDCSLQVTEEEIALCMGEDANPLMEIDQESIEEHPLRILSEENLSVVSTFTDSLSGANEMDFPQSSNQLGVGILTNNTFPSNHPLNSCHHAENVINPSDLSGLSSTEARNSGFKQLSKLHEVYRNKLAKVSATKLPCDSFQSDLYNSASRHMSLSLTDMFRAQWRYYSPPDYLYSGVKSIHSEPTYYSDHSIQEQLKMQNNSQIGFGKSESDKTRFPHASCQSRDYFCCDNICEDVFFPLNEQISNSCTLSNIYSLRQPDGASNPNLPEEVERKLEYESSTVQDRIGFDTKERNNENKNFSRREMSTTVGVDKVENDDPSPDLPPPLIVPATSLIHKRLFIKERVGLKPTSSPICLEEYDSGHDSSSHRIAKQSVISLRSSRKTHPGCESSGYESVLRDSESSSVASSQDSDHSSHIEFHNSRIRDTVTAGALPTSSCKGEVSTKVPVLQYFKEDVDRFERRFIEMRGGKIRELRREREDLKGELFAAKSRLLIPRNRWSYELHVEDCMDHRHPSFVEALQRETEILRKRVEACKSHILIATCFDSIIKGTED